MPALDIVIAPDPIFKQTSAPVETVDDEVRQLINDMFDTLDASSGLGIAASMVGITKRIITIDLKENGISNRLACINPEVVWTSEETSEYEEASLSFPGIGANITRPSKVRLKYLDENGDAQELEADVPLSTVIQHEMDYLDGRTYLDHLSRMKRDRLLKKMQKMIHTHQMGHSHAGHNHDHSCEDPDCGHDH